MNVLDPERFRISNSDVWASLEPEREATLLVGVAWWTKDVNLRIRLNQRASLEGDNLHWALMDPRRMQEQNIARLNSILNKHPEFPLEEDTMNSCFNTLVWNCRGAGNNTFRNTFSELVNTYHPDVVALLETKFCIISSMGMFFNNKGFTSASYVDPIGKAGGIWLLWDPGQVKVTTTHITNQVIHATISKDPFEEWLLSAVYASPNPRSRESLWDDMESFAGSVQTPWLVAGDLNDTVNSSERKGTSPEMDANRNRKFMDRVNNCNLMDKGSSGQKFTWTKGRQGLANTQKRLDRALCNAEWRALFPEGMVQNLPRTYSDHSPILICVFGMPNHIPRSKPFRLEAAWMLDPSFPELVCKAWAGNNIK